VGLVPESPKPPKPKPEPLPEPPLVAPEPVDAGAVESADLISRIGVAPEPTGVEPISAPAPSAIPDAGAVVINLPPPAPREPFVSSVDVSAGGGFWYAREAAGAVSLDVGVTLRERVRVAVIGVVATPITKTVEDRGITKGSVEWVDIGAFAVLGACTKTSLMFCGHAFGGARFRWATANGMRIFQVGNGVVPLAEAGALARLQYTLSHLLLALEVMAGVPLGQGTVRVRELMDFTTPPVDLIATLRIGLKFP